MLTGDTAAKTSLLLVRAWFESGHLRARMTTTLDLAEPTETVRHFDSASQVEAAVHEWLEAVTATDLSTRRTGPS
jgi:hypothetical protein